MTRRLSAVPDQPITIEVPGSTANLGLYFDAAGAALNEPVLSVTAERISGHEIELDSSQLTPAAPEGLTRGFAGTDALEQYLYNIAERPGIKLTYRNVSEHGFPSGGTGSSGAEAVAAIMASGILLGRTITLGGAIHASAQAEPQQHLDNVLPSLMGGIVFTAKGVSDRATVGSYYRIAPPESLGLAIGFSSHQKTAGTKGARAALRNMVPTIDFVGQVARATIAALALERGEVGTFLEHTYTPIPSTNNTEPRLAYTVILMPTT